MGIVAKVLTRDVCGKKLIVLMSRAALHQLILDLFEDALHVRNFFLLHYDNAFDLVHALPSVQVSVDQFAAAAILALEVRGLIDNTLFDRLIVVRPTRRGEILRVAAMWDARAVSVKTDVKKGPHASSEEFFGVSFDLRFRTEMPLDVYGVTSRTAGQLTLIGGAISVIDSLTLDSTIGHIQRLPSLGRGSRTFSVSRQELRIAECSLVWGEFDIRIATLTGALWQILIQDRTGPLRRDLRVSYLNECSDRAQGDEL